VIGILFVILCVVLVIAPHHLPMKETGQPVILVRVGGLIGLFIALSATIESLTLGVADYRYYHGLLQNGKYTIIEGEVENFVPMPYEGHSRESFTVKGVRFSYSDFDNTPGFNNTSSHGGPIKGGLYVRIYYATDPDYPHENRILKLEIGQ
jgi:hypothetical protein